MKLHALACFHIRPQLHEIFVAGLKNANITSATFVCNSDYDGGKEDKIRLRELSEKYGITTQIVLAPNNPVSNKHNYGLSRSLELDWDALVIMGSDDLISPEGVELLKENLKQKTYVGFNQVHFLNSETFEWIKYKYEDRRLVGCGRAIRRDVFDRISRVSTITFRKEQEIAGAIYEKNYPFDFPEPVALYLESIGFAKIVSREARFKGLWESGLNRSLDHSSEMHLAMLGYAPHVIKTDRVHLIDIKTNQNVTFWGNLFTKSEVANKDEAMWFLSEDIRVMISKLKFVV